MLGLPWREAGRLSGVTGAPVAVVLLVSASLDLATLGEPSGLHNLSSLKTVTRYRYYGPHGVAFVLLCI